MIWHPHHINNSFKVKFNNNPSKIMAIPGRINNEVYPFRYYASQLTEYPIDKISQMKEFIEKPNAHYGKNFIKILNNYLACITCCALKNRPYIVAKFFEIPASGALLLAYDEHVKEQMLQLGFKDGINYISVNYHNIKEKIAFVFDPANREKIDTIRKNGYKLIYTRHTSMNRAKHIDKVINDALNTKLNQ